MQPITIHAPDDYEILIRKPFAAGLPETFVSTLDTSGLPEAGNAASLDDTGPVAAIPRFTRILDDGTHLQANDARTDHVAVLDNTTGLVWSVDSLGDPDDEDSGITQEHAAERCRQLCLLGKTDWDLPTRTELAGLIDDTRHEPAIDTTAFPRVKARRHWTKTPAAWSPSVAWYVYFSYGYVYDYHRDGVGFALAVRRAGQ